MTSFPAQSRGKGLAVIPHGPSGGARRHKSQGGLCLWNNDQRWLGFPEEIWRCRQGRERGRERQGCGKSKRLRCSIRKVLTPFPQHSTSTPSGRLALEMQGPVGTTLPVPRKSPKCLKPSRCGKTRRCQPLPSVSHSSSTLGCALWPRGQTWETTDLGRKTSKFISEVSLRSQPVFPVLWKSTLPGTEAP